VETEEGEVYEKPLELVGSVEVVVGIGGEGRPADMFAKFDPIPLYLQGKLSAGVGGNGVEGGNGGYVRPTDVVGIGSPLLEDD
jgi:hypothetical protein